jgi:hypothetical protein
MMPNEPLRDIMRRTVENLKFVERNAAPTGPFEVTQLINPPSPPGRRGSPEVRILSFLVKATSCMR